jgi:transposase
LRIRYIAGSDDGLDFQEICNLQKEPTSEKSPWIGLTPRRHQSGSVEQQLRISKAGNKQLRSLVQCAQYLLGRFGPDSDLKRWGTRMFEQGGKNSKKRAIVAVARKLAVLLHRLWVTGDTYHPLYNVATSSVTS